MRYAAPAHLAWVAVDAVGRPVSEDNLGDATAVYVMQMPHGAPLLLPGSAALIWLLAVDAGGDIAGVVARHASVDPDIVRPDVTSYLVELLGRGLLIEVSPQGRAAGDQPERGSAKPLV